MNKLLSLLVVMAAVAAVAASPAATAPAESPVHALLAVSISNSTSPAE